MKLEEIVNRLHMNERKIILAMEENTFATTESLGIITGLSLNAIEKASSWAETKGVLSFIEEVSRTFFLTSEGKKYVQEGLPEKKLLDLLSQGVTKINVLKIELASLNIALVWLKRNKWGNIVHGEIQLTTQGENARKIKRPEEKLLEKLRDNGLDETSLNEEEAQVIEVLLKRGLIDQDKTVKRSIMLTEYGRKLIPILKKTRDKKIITQITPEIIRSQQWRNSSFQKYDINLPAPKMKHGKRHFISEVIDYIRRFWVELGFKEMKGNYLELSFWNFDALFQPQDHPARDLADTFYIKSPKKGRLPDQSLVKRVGMTHKNGWTTGSRGWGYDWDSELSRINCLRTHTTSLSVNQIAKLKPEDLPAKYFSVGRVFRNETIDWNHLIEFYQTDGIVIGEGVNFRNLQGYLKAYLEGLGLERFRFRPGYFPYTEMSLEAEVWIEDRNEWMELFGAGIFRPEVVKPLIGIDVPVLAWGPGFDRLVMQSYHIENIKDIYSNDIGFLREAKLWIK
jgi:phenylalanyl-tRNA synthetase alpha chain